MVGLPGSHVFIAARYARQWLFAWHLVIV